MIQRTVWVKPWKVAESGIPDLWTESVENGYYIVPYYFLDEKDNEHTVSVYHEPYDIIFDVLKHLYYLTESNLTTVLTTVGILDSVWQFLTNILN